MPASALLIVNTNQTKPLFLCSTTIITIMRLMVRVEKKIFIKKKKKTINLHPYRGINGGDPP